MVVHSAAVLPTRIHQDRVSVFIAHMGGPFWSRKDDGAWSLVKGEFDPDGEDRELASRREFLEETGFEISDRPLALLGEFRLPSGKRLHVFTLAESDGVEFVRSNEFEMEWPKGSGVVRSFPEIDRAGWMSIADARRKLVKGQLPVLDHLMAHLTRTHPGAVEGEAEAGDQPLF